MIDLKNSFRIASVAAVLLAGSCAAPMNDGTSWSNDPAANHPIAVEPHFAALKVNFAPANAGLLPDDADRFEAFVADYLSRGSGSISISAPQDSDAAATYRYFANRMFEMGVPRSRILVGTHAANDQRVEIGFISYTASTKPCGDWSKNAGDTADNSPSPNFGCAVQHNIAAQVADPRDLIEQRPSDPADTNRRTAVLGAYEQGKVTSSEKSKDQTGAVSDVNK